MLFLSQTQRKFQNVMTKNIFVLFFAVIEKGEFFLS